jgi:hypothetical protein
MVGENPKEKQGVSIREVGSFTQRHCFELFFASLFVLACIFSFVLYGPGWSVVALALGGLIGVFFSHQMTHFVKKIFHFHFKQKKIIQTIFAIIALILSILISPLIFLFFGIHAGKDMRHWASEISAQFPQEKE